LNQLISVARLTKYIIGSEIACIKWVTSLA
jgi:hypothetical protein